MVLVTPASVIAVGVVLPLLAAISVGLRFVVRRSRTAYVGVDDWLILFALILCVGLGIMMIVGSAMHALAQPTPLGKGPKGFLTVLNKAIVVTEKMKFVINLTQLWAFGAIKLSVLFFYRRIFKGKIFDICTYVMICIVVAWTLSFFFAFLFQCGTNFGANWSTLKALLTQCHAQHTYQLAMAVSDVLTDGLILLIPIPLVWKLQMSTERKLAVSGVFLLGTGALAASIARLTIFDQKLIGSFIQSQGIELITTWLYFTMIEMGISIMAACLPTLRPLFGKWSPEKISQIRSIFSLHSISSSIFRRRTTMQNTPGHKDFENASNSSSSRIVESKPDDDGHHIGTETMAMKDLEAQQDTPPGKIVVHNHISHHTSAH